MPLCSSSAVGERVRRTTDRSRASRRFAGRHFADEIRLRRRCSAGRNLGGGRLWTGLCCEWPCESTASTAWAGPFAATASDSQISRALTLPHSHAPPSLCCCCACPIPAHVSALRLTTASCTPDPFCACCLYLCFFVAPYPHFNIYCRHVHVTRPHHTTSTFADTDHSFDLHALRVPLTPWRRRTSPP